MILASIWNPSVEETVGAVVWGLLTCGALLALRRQPAGARGAWIVTAAYSAVVVADKVVDLQMAFYGLSRTALHWLVSGATWSEHRTALRLAVVLPLTVTALAATWWLVRRDRAVDRPKQLALAGLAGILLYVGLRPLPGVGAMVTGNRGLVLEYGCVALVAAGEWMAMRSRPS